MRNEKLQIFKITFTYHSISLIQTRGSSDGPTVVAPRSSQKLLDVGVTALLLAHLESVAESAKINGWEGAIFELAQFSGNIAGWTSSEMAGMDFAAVARAMGIFGVDG